MDQELKDHLHALTALVLGQKDQFQELRTYLDDRFKQIDGRFERVDDRFKQVDDRFKQVDDRFKQVDDRFKQIDGRFEQIDGRFKQIDSRFEQVDGRFERVEETGRHTLVLVEGLRGQLQLMAEAFLGSQEKKEADRGEVLRAIEEVKSLVRQSYSALDQRVLEIERWRDRQGRDPIDVLRERFGKTS